MPVLSWATSTIGFTENDHVIAANGDTWVIVQAGGGVYRSTDKGVTWSSAGSVAADLGGLIGLLHDGSAFVLAIAHNISGDTNVYTSTAGTSWALQSSIAHYQPGRWFEAGGNVFWWNFSGDTIYRSADLDTWDALTLPSSGYISYLAGNGTTLIGAQSSAAGEIFRSTNNGNTWSYASAPSTESVEAVAYLPISGRWVFSARDGVRFSADGGVTWGAPVNTGLPTYDGGYYVGRFVETSAGVLAQVSSATAPANQGIYLLPTGGSTWAAEQTSEDYNYGAILAASTDRVAFWTGAAETAEYRFASLGLVNDFYLLAPDPLADIAVHAKRDIQEFFAACPDPIADLRVRALIDWTQGLDLSRLQASYLLTVAADGFDPVQIPISSWQATANEGERASFVQAVIPAAADWIAALDARQGGTLTINMGYRLDDGRVRYDEIATASFGEFRYDRGARSVTATVSGYAYLSQSEAGARALRDVQTFALQGGKLRVTCALDMMLKPGMTATVGEQSFVVGYINYYANRSGAFCHVGER